MVWRKVANRTASSTSAKGKKVDPRRIFRGHTYDSIFECNCAKDIYSKNALVKHNGAGKDRTNIPWVEDHKYYPDFVVCDFYGTLLRIIEVKGYFESCDRTKHLRIKKQHPNIEQCFVFQNANKKLNPRSKTSYGDWADKYGFKWVQGTKVPKEWLT